MRLVLVIAPYLPTKCTAGGTTSEDIGRKLASVIAERRALGLTENDILQGLFDGRHLLAYGDYPPNDSKITGLLIGTLQN
jgi:hypothetical protein